MEKNREGFLYNVLKGSAISVIALLLFILLFAFILSIASISTGVVKAVNQFIKIIAVFLGCFFSVRGKAGLIKGLVIGAIYICFAYLLFLIMGSGNNTFLSFITDLLFGAVAGAISGIITVNVKK